MNIMNRIMRQFTAPPEFTDTVPVQPPYLLELFGDGPFGIEHRGIRSNDSATLIDLGSNKIVAVFAGPRALERAAAVRSMIYGERL
jgi:hypothetical protein